MTAALLPNMVNRFAFDATRLSDMLACARRALYAHVYGLVRRGAFEIDLEMGSALHAAMEARDHALMAKRPDESSALRAALRMAWNLSAHWPAEGSEQFDGKKNRKNLLRAICWYAEQFPARDDVLAIVRLTDGAPAIEIPFSEKILAGRALLVSRPDNIVQFEPFEVYVRERKTTGSALGSAYDARWSPNIQITMQAIAGERLLADSRFRFRGVILESFHFAVGSVRFSRNFIDRTPAQIAESRVEIESAIVGWLGRLDGTRWDEPPTANYAAYPKNESACALCRYKAICAADPRERPRIVAERFEQREPWNPLEQRRTRASSASSAKIIDKPSRRA